MSLGYWSDVPAVRIRQLKALSPAQREAHIAWLNERAPVKPWPSGGFPCCAAPLVVFLGSTPGAWSEGKEPLQGTPPRFGECVFRRKGEEDPKRYQDKLRSLTTRLVRRYAPDLPPEECCKLPGHVNLGRQHSGRAEVENIERRVTQWSAGLLGSRFPAKIVVCFGVRHILSKHDVNEIWNSADGGLRVDWTNREEKIKFHGHWGAFRLWFPRRADGCRIVVAMWPNHPSRYPFSGSASGESWLAAEEQFCKILDRRGQ